MSKDNQEREEITQIGKCIVSVDRRSNIYIDCKEPVDKIVIEKSDVDLISGLTETVQKYADVVKKER